MHYNMGIKWKVGHIAFLRKWDDWSAEDVRAVDNKDWARSVHVGATGHPVIILLCDDKQAIVTTVSAYRSGAHNNNLAPWKTTTHRRKRQSDFRAFHGSELPNNSPALQLAGGKHMPKMATSWVYTPFTTIVPITTLIPFDKADSLLRMTEDSYNDILRHTAQASKFFAAQKRILDEQKMVAPVQKSRPNPSPAPPPAHPPMQPNCRWKCLPKKG